MTKNADIDLDKFSEIDLTRLRKFIDFSRNKSSSCLDEFVKTFDCFSDFRSFKSKLESAAWLADSPQMKEFSEACYKKF